MSRFTGQIRTYVRSFLCIAFACILNISAQADIFYVSTSGNDGSDGSQARPWRTIRKAASAVPAGNHTIMLAAGTYDEKSADLKPGVSLQGAGVDKTIISVGTWLWNEGALRLISGSMTVGNQSLKGFTLDGRNHNGWSGIQIINRSNITITDVKIQQFFDNAIGITADYGTTARNIEIGNFEIRESSRESGNSSQGNITTRGNMDNLQIHDGAIYHQTNVPVGPWGDKSSGYAIKCFASWNGSGFNSTDLVSNSKIYNIRDVGKSSAAWGNNVPNLGFEFWYIGGSEVEIYNCDMTTQISLEHDLSTPYAKGKYTFWVHDNRFKVATGASLELTVSNTIIERNVFDYRDNVNAWNVMGEYNQKPKGGSNIHVRRNYFILGKNSPIIWALNNASDGIYFYNNTITGDGDLLFPPIFQMRTPHSGRISNNLQVLNNVFDVGTNNTVDYCIYDNGVGQPSNAVLRNNHHSKPFKSIPNGASVSGNRQGVPAIRRSGAYPLPYMESVPNGALIDAGTANLPLAPIPMSFSGNAPDIGAFESGQAAVIPANQNPAIKLTSPANNASVVSGSNVSLNTETTDADGTVAKVEFFANDIKIGEAVSAPWSFNWNRPAQGNYSLKAVATDDKGAKTTSAAISFSVAAPAANQNPTVSITSPTDKTALSVGASLTINVNAADADGLVARIEFFAGAVKIGEKTTAPWTMVWSNLAQGDHVLTAKAVDNKNAETVSAAMTVTVKPVIPPAMVPPPVAVVPAPPPAIVPPPIVAPVPPAPAPVPPASSGVSVTSPSEGAIFTEGDNVLFSASVPAGTAKVEFFINNGYWIGQRTLAPWQMGWNGVSVGQYVLSVKVTASNGAVTVSPSIRVIVKAKGAPDPVVLAPAPNQLPLVAVTSPKAAAQFEEGNAITITASASDADGSVAKVEFFANSIRIGEQTSAPWTMVWNNAPKGNHSITAKVTDNRNASVTSAAVSITINSKSAIPQPVPAPMPVAVAPAIVPAIVPAPAPVPAPVATGLSITSPADGAVFTEGDNVLFSASAPAGTAKVEFFINNGYWIGQRTSAPWQMGWNGVSVGQYVLSVKATASNGAVSVSPSIRVTVVKKGAPIPAPTPAAPVAGIPAPTAPSFYRAVNLNGSSMQIDGQNWAGSNAPNYTYSGTPYNLPSVTLNPATDANRTDMIRSCVGGRNVNVALTAVPAATYDVYLYVWEDNSSETFSVFLEGKVVQANYVSGGAGTWKRLGPFRTAITDGAINVAATGGFANLSGIEVWQVPAAQGASASVPTQPGGRQAAPPVENTVKLVPNPASDRVGVRFNVAEAQEASIVVTNMGSQQVMSIAKAATAGENTVSLEISSLMRGMYIVYVKTKQGMVSQKLVVTR